MSYLLNYKNWRAIHEAALFEAKDSSLKQTGVGSGLVAVLKGNAIYDISDGGVTPEWGWLDPAKSGLFFETLSDTVGFGGIPMLFINAGNSFRGGFGAGSNKSKDSDALMDVFKLLVCGIGRYHGIENFGDQMVEGADGKTAVTRLEEMGLTVTQDGEVQMYGPNLNMINASAKIEDDGSVLNSTKPVNTNKLSVTLNYINTFNLINFAEGNSQQYVNLAACLDDNKVLQLGTGAKGVSVNETALYLYSPKTGSVKAASMETVTTTTQGKAGLDDTVNLAFTPNEFATTTNAKNEVMPVDETNAEIRDVANKILAALGEDQQITKMTLVSGASPDWQGLPVPDSNGSGEPGGGKLNATNFKSEKTALGNQWLAWKRGRQFADALEKLLGAKRIAAGALTIEWKVGKGGAQDGRNLAYSVTSTGVAPKDKTETIFAGASYNTGGAANTFYRYKFTWNYDKLSNAEGGWMKKLFGKQTASMGDLEVGMEITYKGKIKNANGDVVISDKKADYQKAEVISMEGGQPQIQGKSGPITIGTDRFISGPKSAKSTAFEE
jgi:hypothetical protein